MSKPHKEISSTEFDPSNEVVLMNSFSPMTTAANIVVGFVGEASHLLTEFSNRARKITESCIGLGIMATGTAKTIIVDRIQDYHDGNRGNLRGAKK